MTTTTGPVSFLDQQRHWQGQMQAVFMGEDNDQNPYNRMQSAISSGVLDNTKLTPEQMDKLKQLSQVWDKLRKITQLHQAFLDLYQQNPQSPQVMQKYTEFTILLQDYAITDTLIVTKINDPLLGQFKKGMTNNPFIGQYFKATNESKLSADGVDKQIQNEVNARLVSIEEAKKQSTLDNRFNEFLSTEQTFQLQMDLLLKVVKPYLDKVTKGEEKLKKRLSATEIANIKMADALFAQIQKIKDAQSEYIQSYQKEGFSKKTNEKFTTLSKELEVYSGLYSDFIAKTVKLPEEVENGIRAIANNLGLVDLLVSPTQVVSRMEMKSKDLLKDTPKTHPKYEAIQTFVGIAQQSTEIINASTGEVAALQDERRKYKKANTRVTVKNTQNENSMDQIETLLAKSLESTSLQYARAKAKADKEEDRLGVPRRIKDKIQHRKTFNIKNKEGEVLFKVNVYPTYISVKQVGDRVLPRDQYLEELKQIHDLVSALWIDKKSKKPILYTTDSETLNEMCTLCYKDKQPAYAIGKKGNKQIQQQWTKEKAVQSEEFTCNMKFDAFIGSVPYVQQPPALEQAGIILLRNQLADVVKRGAIPVLDNRGIQNQIDKKLKAVAALRTKLVQSEQDKADKRAAIENANSEISFLRKFLNQGNFVKAAATPSQVKIEIDTKDAVLAIKQFEGILAAGFLPVFTPKTAAAVNNFVKGEVNRSFNYMLDKPEVAGVEKQINILGPLGKDGKIDGAEVLERIKLVAQNGMLVNLAPEAQSALREYMRGLDPTQLASIMVPVKYKGSAEPIMVVRNLVELGLMPYLDTTLLRASVKKGQDLPPLVINSGSTQLDFENLKRCYSALGMRADVADKEKIRAHVGSIPLTTLIISQISKTQQLEEAKRLAGLGINCRIDVPVPSESAAVIIDSTNPEHAVKIFQNLLSQGFSPTLSEATKQVFSKVEIDLGGKDALANYQVHLQGDKPADLLKQLESCFKAGLAVKIDDEQKHILQKHIEKMGTALPIMRLNCNHGSILRANRELAIALDLKIHLTGYSVKANIEELAKLKERDKDKAIMPILRVPACYKTKAQTFGKDKRVIDLDRTLSHATIALREGYVIKLSDEVQKAIEKITEASLEKDSKGRPTKKALVALKQVQAFDPIIRQQIKLADQNRENFRTATPQSLHQQAIVFGGWAETTLKTTDDLEARRKGVMIISPTATKKEEAAPKEEAKQRKDKRIT